MTTKDCIKLFEDIREQYLERLSKHNANAAACDRDENWVEYMTERTMQAYCRGCVQTYDTVLTTLRAGVVSDET